MIELIGAKAIEGALTAAVEKAAVEKAAEIQVQRDMALLLQQQETLRVGEIQAREVLSREVIAERESSAAEELQRRMDAEAQATDPLADASTNKPASPEVKDAHDDRTSFDSDLRKSQQDVRNEEVGFGSDRVIYERADVDVNNPITRTLVDREYQTFRIPEIEGDLICPDGLSNSERAQQGLASYRDIDGRLVKVELHHDGQKQDGPLIELDASTHRGHHAELHPGLGKGEGRGEDSLWSQRVSEYWKQRDFTN